MELHDVALICMMLPDFGFGFGFRSAFGFVIGFGNASMQPTIAELKVVMQGIGGDQFQDIATDIGQMEAIAQSNVTILSNMLKVEVDSLQSKGNLHDESFNRIFVRLNEVDQKLLSAIALGAGQGLSVQVEDSGPLWVEA